MASRPAVLIVDDEPVAAAMFIRALESKGVGTLYCDNAEEALVQAKNVAPLVVVSDVEMPGMGRYRILPGHGLAGDTQRPNPVPDRP